MRSNIKCWRSGVTTEFVTSFNWWYYFCISWGQDDIIDEQWLYLIMWIPWRVSVRMCLRRWTSSINVWLLSCSLENIPPRWMCKWVTQCFHCGLDSGVCILSFSDHSHVLITYWLLFLKDVRVTHVKSLLQWIFYIISLSYRNVITDEDSEQVFKWFTW